MSMMAMIMTAIVPLGALFAFAPIAAVPLGVIHAMVVIVGKSEPGHATER
jgi:hypothetical protein